MQQITLRLDEDVLESVEGEADERGVSRSEYLRDVIASRHEADELRTEHEEEVRALRTEHEEKVRELRSEHTAEVEELESRIDELERELEVTENKLQEARQQMKHREQIEEKVEVLAKRVEDSDEPAPPFPVRWWQWLRSRRTNGTESGEPAD